MNAERITGRIITKFIDRVCKSRYTQDDHARVVFIMELIMLKRDVLRISDEFFSVQTLP